MNSEKEQQIRDDAMLDAAMHDRSETKEAMKGWFLKRYEDPAENTAYDSSSGGYLYQWGGPFDAHDILYDQFHDIEDPELIAEAAKELEKISLEWERIPTLEDISPDDIPESLESYEVLDIDIDSVSLNRPPEKTHSRFYRNFYLSVSRVFDELGEQVGRGDPFLCSLLYAYLITTLEVYFQDSFTEALKDPSTGRRFVAKFQPFKEEKISLSELYDQLTGIDQKITEELLKIIWHRLEVIQKIFHNILEIQLPSIGPVYSAVLKRHDIVHRGCRNKKGTEFTITKDETVMLGNLLNDFVMDVDRKYCEKYPAKAL